MSTTYDPKALDMAANIAENLSADEIRGVRSMIEHISEAPDGDILFGEGIPLVTRAGAIVGELVLDPDSESDQWVFEPTKRSTKAADEGRSRDADEPAKDRSPSRTRRG